MEFKKNTKIVTFKESYHGESYVAFAEDKTENYIFNKFLTWVSYYSNSFSEYFSSYKDNLTKILQDFETSQLILLNFLNMVQMRITLK